MNQDKNKNLFLISLVFFLIVCVMLYFSRRVIAPFIIAFALAAILIVIGARGIESSSGLRTFLHSIIQRPRQMMSSEGELSLIVANWMVVGGILFYIIWSTINTTWVDPGVYSVSIVVIASGLGIEAMYE